MDSGIITHGGDFLNCMSREECERFISDNGLRLHWNYRDWPDRVIPINEFYLNRNKSAYEKLLYCPNFVMSRKRDRHGIVVSGWFDTWTPLAGRIVYKKPLMIRNYPVADKQKFLDYACEIYLEEGYNVEFITFDDEITNDLLIRFTQLSIC